jgi:peptidoglycan/xylan/chitin deacetylase (PgdA/CDA1 family)
VPLLEGAKAPATFFLTGASLRGEGSFWWHDLQRVANRGGQAWTDLLRDLDETSVWTTRTPSIHKVGRKIECMAPEERDKASERIRAAAGSADGQLSSGEIERIAGSGFEIGFHTLRHYNLQTIDGGRLSQALTEGVEDLQALTGHRPTLIAYPHCRADLRVAEAARAAGFEFGCICDGGPVRYDDDPLLVDRIDAWSDSIGRFALRLARAAAQPHAE